MDKYDETQFKEMKKRYTEDKTFENWDSLYTEMRKDLEELKKQNKLQDERIRVKAILECAEQKKENVGLDKAMPVVSLFFSIAATIISLFPNENILLILCISATLVISAIAIFVVYTICGIYCNIRRNDIVYYKTKLDIIDMLIEEDANKQIEENC